MGWVAYVLLIRETSHFAGRRLNRWMGACSIGVFVVQLALVHASQVFRELSPSLTTSLYAVSAIGSLASLYLKFTSFEYYNQKLEYAWTLSHLLQLLLILMMAIEGSIPRYICVGLPLGLLAVAH